MGKASCLFVLFRPTIAECYEYLQVYDNRFLFVPDRGNDFLSLEMPLESETVLRLENRNKTP